MTILRAGGLGGGGLAVSRLQSGQIVSSGPITISSPNVSYFLPDDLPVQIPGAESGVADYTSGDLTIASALPSGLSLAQAGTTRYFNSSGVLSTASANTPRFGNEYDGTNWVQRGLRLEPARTNILLQSNTFNNVAWSTFGGTLTSGATTSPDGTTNAWKLAEDTSATANHDVFQGVVAGTAGIWTMSVYLKAAGRNWVCLNNTKGGGTAHVYVNLSTGAIGTNTGFDNVVITDVGNGWYRCETTVSGMLATDTIYLAIYMATSDLSVNAPTYTGVAGGAGIYLAFGQTELGTGVSSYISTTTAATTRASDALTATAGGALDTILSASGASIVVGSFLRNLGTNGRLIGNSSGTQSPAYVASNTTAGIQGTAGTSSTATLGSAGVYTGSAELTGAAWDWTSGSLVANQGTVSNVNMGPQLGSGAYFFRDSAGTAAVTGFLQSVNAWAGRLSDADLQAATNPSLTINAVVAQTLGALITAATDEVLAQATIAQTLGVLGQAAPTTVLDQAVAAQTLSALAQAATASAPAGAVTAETLGAIGQAAAATAPLAITVAQSLAALTQTAAATHPDTAAAAQTLGAIVQAATGGVIDQATAAQTLTALAQAAAASAPAALTASQTLGPLGQSVTATSAHAALVAQTLGAIAQATSGAVIDVAAVSQALGPLNQAATATAASTGFQAAQTLGGIVQALTGTAIDAATVAQALGGLSQAAAGGIVATVPARTDSLGPLGQTATGEHVRLANVAEVLGVLSQIATAQGPGEADFLAGQILGALQQVAASNVAQRIQANQALAALGQAIVVRQAPTADVHIGGSLSRTASIALGSFRQKAILSGPVARRSSLRGSAPARSTISGSLQ